MTSTNPSPKSRRFSIPTILVIVLVGLALVWWTFHRSVASQVQQRFSGHLFELPSVVYARELVLSIDSAVSQQELLDELTTLNYQQVSTPANSGEYRVSGNNVTLVRRPFQFSDGYRDVQRVSLTFGQSGLRSIHDVDTGAELGLFSLEPKLMGMIGNDGHQQRLYQSWQDMPEGLITALLLTEDRAFWQHDGISVTAIARAFLTNLKAGRTVQGGSTLTQQLTKNLFLTNERSLSRKVREAYMALLIDAKFSKDEILDGYVNQIYLAQQGSDAIHGFELGAQFYFNKPLLELRIDQQALLVALVKGPSYYNPWRFPERALARRNTVLKLLEQEGYLEESEYQAAIERALDIQVRGQVAMRKPAYFDWVTQELQALAPKMDRAGARIYTTLDPQSQQQAEQSVVAMLPELDAVAGTELDAALLSVDYQTGAIRAVVGNRNPDYAGYNFARDGSRQVGSVIKPVVVLAALSDPQHYNLATRLPDQPLTITLDNGTTWQPRNYNRRYQGEVSLYSMLANSLNVPIVNLGMALELKTVAELVEQLGQLEDPVQPLPSMLLGALELSPEQVSQIYQPIANHGQRNEQFLIRAIVDADDRSVYQQRMSEQQVAPTQASQLTMAALQGTVKDGTAKSLNALGRNYQLAGKTGTTNDNRDSWYVGIDGRELVTVWIGRGDNGKTKLTGTTGALPVYQHYLKGRGPQTLNIDYADDIELVSFRRKENGVLRTSCGRGDVVLPVWGAKENLSSGCAGEEIGNFFKRLFTR
ncbi:penicillin-binding protein 1B [Vibrio sp. WXL210]|uniref:penicillin-binding protein 1B n=1 Tax=Vibrio sp. WXL210 TaxID=3450709 RepID=UPI003EC5D75E